jgi:hypothetical protein
MFRCLAIHDNVMVVSLRNRKAIWNTFGKLAYGNPKFCMFFLKILWDNTSEIDTPRPLCILHLQRNHE